MQVNVDQLKSLLEGCLGLRGAPALLDGKLVMRTVAGPKESINVVAEVKESGAVQFRTLKMIMAPERRYRRALLRALADMNYRFKIAKFGFDGDDGEVAAYIDLFGLDAGLTKKQVQRAVGVLGSVVLAGKLRCEKIVASGADPGDMSEQAKSLLLAGMLEGGVEGLIREAGRRAAASEAGGPAKPAPTPVAGSGPDKKAGGLYDILDDWKDDEAKRS